MWKASVYSQPQHILYIRYYRSLAKNVMSTIPHDFRTLFPLYINVTPTNFMYDLYFPVSSSPHFRLQVMNSKPKPLLLLQKMNFSWNSQKLHQRALTFLLLHFISQLICKTVNLDCPHKAVPITISVPRVQYTSLRNTKISFYLLFKLINEQHQEISLSITYKICMPTDDDDATIEFNVQ